MSDNEASLRHDIDYQFTLANGDVTGMQAVLGGQTYDLHPPSNATFTVDTGANTVTETLTGTYGAKVITYTLEAGSTTLYDKSDVTTTFANPDTTEGGFTFTIANGAVTGEQRVDIENIQTQTEEVHIAPDAVFTIDADAGTITEQWVKGNEVDTIVFTQPTGSTLYAVASVERAFIDGGTATTFLDVKPNHRMEFTIDPSGNVTEADRLDAAGGLHTVTNPNATFTQLAPGYVEKVVTHGSETSYAVYYEGQAGNGIYTEIAHGSGSTVDLAGLQTQVTEAEQLLKSAPSTSTGWII